MKVIVFTYISDSSMLKFVYINIHFKSLRRYNKLVIILTYRRTFMLFFVFEFVYLKVFEFMTNQYYVFSNHFFHFRKQMIKNHALSTVSCLPRG